MPSKNFVRYLILIALIVVSLAALINRDVHSVHAQIPESEWTAPINLSNSGGTTTPGIVVDSSGSVHVIWQDAYLGTVYSGFDGTQWSPPIPLLLPFSPPPPGAQPGAVAAPGILPTFVADPSGLVHAFWTDAQNALFHSYVPGSGFSDPGAWSVAAQLAESAVDFDVVVDDLGSIHLAYVRNLDSSDFPAGIYYRMTDDRGLSWSVPALIYQSPYYRAATNTSANVDLESQVGPEDDALFISWDNRLRKQVFFSQSDDGGISWNDPELVDSSTEDNPSARPINIRSVSYSGGLLRLWQDGDPALGCMQYYESSTNGGSSWSDRQEILGEISGCPQDLYFFVKDNILLMMISIQGQVYLLAWDGSQWSDPQMQGDLLSFEDPATFDQVIFDCRQPAQSISRDLVVVGCDTGTGGDIWITQRSIGDTTQWFPPPSSWNVPEEIIAVDTPITNPILLSDSQGLLHSFWVQQGTATPGSASTPVRDVIFYSRKENDRWTRPVAVLQSPNGMTRQPSAAIDANDNLFVVWSGGEAGEIYFSRALGSRANSPAEWVQPMLLPAVRQAGSSPTIQVDANGSIYVAYAIPLNENRGIYINKSQDGGLSWSEPLLAFDAVKEGWDMVDEPHLSVSGTDIYNLLIGNYSIPGGTGSKGLYTTRSTDGGANWSDVLTVSERPVAWSELIQASNGALHQIWIEDSIFGTTYQHEISGDYGVSWATPVSVSTVGISQGDPVIASDPAGELHLLQVNENSTQLLSLLTWRWDGTNWISEQTLELGSSADILASSISAAVSPFDRLSIVLSGMTKDLAAGIQPFWLSSSSRVIDISDVIPLTVIELPVERIATPVAEITVMPSPTSEVVLPTLPPDPGQATSWNSWIGLTIAAVLAGVFAVLVFTIRVIGMKR